MSLFSDNFRAYVQRVLHLSVPERIPELNVLFERCNHRELQDIFPYLVHSVFGCGGDGVGWGLRTTTRKNAPYCFNILCEFFCSNGPFFRLCYRLLNENVKFEVSLDILPHKVSEMLQSGQYPMFYTDLVNIDPFRRRVANLQLNAFDYFMLHFAVHGTLPLHEFHPAAQQVNADLVPTVYFQLCTDYFTNFLPSNPDGVVYPTDISPMAKVPPTIQLQPVEPKKKLKYLKLPSSSGIYQSNGPNCGGSPPPCGDRMLETRDNRWRTESVLYFFIDTWLCYDIEQARNLPSSEFLRVVRILVKCVHAFANASCYDNSYMENLRKLAQPMLRIRFYPFVLSIIGRWPLDSSMFVLLELWLTYIQPWRYTHDILQAQIVHRMTPAQMEERQRLELSSPRYNTFIVENLMIYTQIFGLLLSRFIRLDFGTHRNAEMLLRLVKTLNQSCLINKLFEAEQHVAKNTLGYDASPRKTASSSFLTSPASPYPGAGVSRVNDWPSNATFAPDGYNPMFGPEMRCEVEKLIHTICVAHSHVKQEIGQLKRKKVLGSHAYLNLVYDLYDRFFQHFSEDKVKLRQLEVVPQMLEWAIQTLCQMFNLQMPDYSWEERNTQADLNYSQYTNSFRDGEFDISRVSPEMMRNNLSNLNNTIDPALLPIQTHENKFLVRSLHRISSLLNERFGEDFSDWWQQPTVKGKIWRQILSPPMTAMWFDKPRGVNELCEDQLPPRLSLRPLASYHVLFVLGLAMLVGQFLWSSPVLGLMAFSFLFFVYIFVLALIS